MKLMDNEVKHVKIVYEADEINSDLDLRFARMLAKEHGLGLWNAGHKNSSRYLIFCRLMLSEAEAKS